MALDALQYWHWLVLGVVLLVVDLAAIGTTFLMWIGGAALVTGAITFLLPLGWTLQLVVFSVMSVVSVWAWKRFVKEPPAPDNRLFNQRGAEHIGRVVPLEEAIVGGRGRIRLDDTLWSVRGADAPAGSMVRIRAQDGNAFDVDPA